MSSILAYPHPISTGPIKVVLGRLREFAFLCTVNGTSDTQSCRMATG